MKIVRLFTVMVVSLVTIASPCQALAEDSQQPFSLVYSNDGGVWDYVTHIEFKKLDKDTSAPIKDVHLQILNYKTHEVVSRTMDDGTVITCDWWTGENGTQGFDKVLNVYDPNHADETTYILHEVKSNKNYESANDVNDVVFRINSTDGEITIVDDPDGRAEIEDKQSLRLYNTALTRYADLEVTEHGEDSTQRVKRNKEGMAQTSDLFNPAVTGVIVLVGAALVILGIKSRRKKDEPVAETASTDVKLAQPDDTDQQDE